MCLYWGIWIELQFSARDVGCEAELEGGFGGADFVEGVIEAGEAIGFNRRRVFDEDEQAFFDQVQTPQVGFVEVASGVGSGC